MNTQIQQALINLLSAKLRSFLAVLGILVGTAAVVALISCGQLATQKALQEFQELGTDLLAITVYQKNPSDKNAHDPLPIQFWRQLAERIHDISNIAPYASLYQPLSFQGKSIQGPIIAADESLAQIIQIDMQEGYFVSHVEKYEHFCVIGQQIAHAIQELNFGSPIGKQLRIGKSLYTIIGVAKPWHENGFFNEDINKAVIIPIAGIALLNRDIKINNAVMRLKDKTDIDATINIITNIIRAQAPEYTVFARSAKQIIASMESQGRIFTLLLAVIGGISLLVGGIGVMNVMLVAVSERKKEIGIRKAVGANRRQIQALFLTESVLLSFLGGILGVLIGLIFTYIVAKFSDWPFHIYLLPPIAGFAISVATGIFFGFYPARRAAMLEAVECLRSE